MLREKLKLDRYEVLHVIIGNGNLPKGETLMKTLYHDFKNEDGLLYVTYANENFAG
jgi:hypothetical protein